MKAIILAAGEGKRLRPFTDDRPKCMVEVNGRSILAYIREAMLSCGISDISAVTGYKADKVDIPGIKKYFNPNFESTNMVYSFFCAQQEFDDDIIISYSDIIYTKEVLEALVASKDDISVIVHKRWKEIWDMRMDDPLSDAESLKLDRSGFIKELGLKTKVIDEIEGQYTGLIKISKEIIGRVKDFYKKLDRDELFRGREFDRMQMTDFIQLIIDRLYPVKAVEITKGWFEVDNPDDLKVINDNFNKIIN